MTPATHVPRRSALFSALLAAAFLLFSAAPALAAPTLSITLSRYAFTTGTTADVTFTFSDPPLGFDNADVDTSNANGSVSTVTATADARVFRATYTPNAAVDDDTNTIIVGTQWSDGFGAGPAGPTSSPNFTVHTSSGGGSGCPQPSVTLAKPNGGETFSAGQQVDVFWTVNGCQLESLRLSLSTDGGATSTPFATVSPFTGFYRWTVQDVGTNAGRLVAALYGQGGVFFASDMTDGTFTIVPSQTSGGTTPPPPAPAPTPAPAPEPAPAPPPPAPASEPPPAPAPAPTPTAVAPPPAPPPAPAPARTTVPVVPAGQIAAGPPLAAATDPNAPLPPDQPTTDVQVQPENDTTMTTPNENQSAMLETAQTGVDLASRLSPGQGSMVLSFVGGALSMLLLLLAAQKVLRDRKLNAEDRCTHCGGSGTEPEEAATGTCEECGGTGQVEEEEEQAVTCKHCEGEGEDPCHACKGKGKDAAGQDCPACKGGGKTLEDPEDDESEIAECEICGGEGEVSGSLTRSVACEHCDGTGKV